jgi:perosamine synthetase
MLGAEEIAAAGEVIASGWVAQGPKVAEFERALARLVGAAEGVAVSSCTTGLHLALLALQVGPGDEVVIPSLSFIATANVVRYVGATPVFADVDMTTQNLTSDTVRPCLTPETKAVIAVHQAGVPADIDDLRRLCEPRGVAIIEDAACAIGSTYHGHLIGSHSDLVTFSFHPRKVITTGEGGMVMTSRPDWAARMRRLREHGMSMSAADRHASGGANLEIYGETGFNYRMTDIQAAIGLVQLTRLDELVRHRRELAERYRRLLGGLPGVVMASDPPYGTTNFQSFWLLLPAWYPLTRSALISAMITAGISPRRGIMAAHLEPAYASLGRPRLPATEHLTSRSLILPLHHELTEADQDRVVDIVLSCASKTA